MQRNVSGAFDAVMRHLGVACGAAGARAPSDFKERIDFWQAECGLPAAECERLHRLRRWRNASEHHDREAWQRDGPENEAEVAELLTAIEHGVAGL